MVSQKLLEFVFGLETQKKESSDVVLGPCLVLHTWGLCGRPVQTSRTSVSMYRMLPSRARSTAWLVGTNTVKGPGACRGGGETQFCKDNKKKKKAAFLQGDSTTLTN